MDQEGKADADEVHSHPEVHSQGGSPHRYQISVQQYMSFDCVNWGLWMTSADIWQHEGLHNFTVLIELWPGGYFRLNLEPHPTDSNFDSILLEQLKQHADSQQSIHPELEGVHSEKESAVPPVPVTCVEAWDATGVPPGASSDVGMATAMKAAATLAAVPPKGAGVPSATAGVFDARFEVSFELPSAPGAPIATSTAAAAAKAVPPAAAGFEAMFQGFSSTFEANMFVMFDFPPRVYEQLVEPILKHLKQHTGIQGVLSNSASMVVQPLPIGSCGKTYRWSRRLKKRGVRSKRGVSSRGCIKARGLATGEASPHHFPHHNCGRAHSWSRRLGRRDAGPRRCQCLTSGIPHICCHGRTFCWSKRLMKSSVVTPYRGCVKNISSIY